MKLLSTGFSFILLFSTIASQIAIASEHEKRKKFTYQEWLGWENEAYAIKKRRQTKYQRNSEKNKKQFIKKNEILK